MSGSGKRSRAISGQERALRGSNGYMPGLDGLRAVAVFAVIAYHLNLSWAPGGLLGVSLFFVLSGYLITNILLNQWEGTGRIDLKDFWLRRARRLLPALFVMLAGVISWILLYAPDRMAALKQEVLAAVSYTSNWYLIFHNVSYFERFGPPSPLGHLWSLAVEEQFYLLWPLLLGLGLRYLPKRKWLSAGTAVLALVSAVAMALIYIPGNDPSRVYYGTDTRAFALLIGAVLAMVWPSHKLNPDLSGKKRLALDVAGGAGLLVVLLMIGLTNQYQTFLYRGGLVLFSLAAACLVAVLAHPASYLGRAFGQGPLRWLGECSYGIYLWHYPVIILTSPTVNTGDLNLTRTFWQITASIVLAALSRYLVEEPIRYGHLRRSRRRTQIQSRTQVQTQTEMQAQMQDQIQMLRQMRMRTQASSRRRRRQSSLALNVKIPVGMVLSLLLLLIVSPNSGTQISAKDLAESNVTQGQTQDQTQAPTQTQEQGQSQNQDQQQSSPTQAADQDAGTAITGNDITAIGDSLMLDVEPVLQKNLPGIVVDGKIGRQMYEAPDVISGLQNAGKLKKIVILELGTNGSFTEGQLSKTLDSLKGAEEIVLVNTRVPRPWETVVNQTLAKVAKSYSNTKLVDWYSASSNHNNYFYPDGVHLNQTGAAAFGKSIIDVLPSRQTSAQTQTSNQPDHQNILQNANQTSVQTSIQTDAKQIFEQDSKQNSNSNTVPKSCYNS